jgi:hypothetical protein
MAIAFVDEAQAGRVLNHREMEYVLAVDECDFHVFVGLRDPTITPRPLAPQYRLEFGHCTRDRVSLRHNNTTGKVCQFRYIELGTRPFCFDCLQEQLGHELSRRIYDPLQFNCRHMCQDILVMHAGFERDDIERLFAEQRLSDGVVADLLSLGCWASKKI